jgi:plasmid stabilization system protein ParE
MAKHQFRLSPEASHDLVSITRYIAAESGRARAEAIAARITRKIQILAFMPRMGVRWPAGARVLLRSSVAPWIVFYEVMPDDGGIHVLRIVDGRRDLETLFEPGD